MKGWMCNMKFYIASRFDKKKEIKNVMQFLQNRGHTVTTDWTKHKPIKPYSEHQEIAKDYAIEDMEGVKNCDIFILLSDEAGTGIYIELGVALALGKKIFVVGPHDDRSMFFFHPQVARRTTIDEVFKELAIV